MIQTTFNGGNAFLIDDAPEWGRANVVVEATIPSAYERGLTGKETRRQTGDTLRLDVRWTALLRSALAVTSLRNSLQALADGPVLCPFWPARFTPGQTPPATTSYYVLFNGDGSFNSIVAAANIGSQSTSLIAYPLLVGVLSDLPDPSLLTSRYATVDFHFAENDNTFLLTPPAFVPPGGISTPMGVRPLFPFASNWVTSPHHAVEYDIERRQIGQVRALSQVYYTQRNRRRIQQDLTLKGSDAMNLLSFFTQMGGETKSFWLPANLKEANLVRDVAATDTMLYVDNPSAIGTNTFICLNDGSRRLPLTVTSISDGLWILSGAVGQAFSASITNLESLVLARFDALKLTLNFVNANWCRTALHFKELPWETAAVAGETIGQTMGPLPTTAMLYTFSLVTPGGTTYWRFTNFERNLTDSNGNVYQSAPIENEEITEAPNLDRQSVTLKARNFPGCPLALMIPFSLEFPLMLTIAECDVT